VKADLEAAGHDGDKLVKAEAPVLLKHLAKILPPAAGEAGRPVSGADQIERLIADSENWMCPWTLCLTIGEQPSEEWRKERAIQEQSRVNAVQNAKLIATALSQLNENKGTRAVLTILNSLEADECNKARKDWPTTKVELQEVAIRLRLKDDAIQAVAGTGRPKQRTSAVGPTLPTFVQESEKETVTGNGRRSLSPDDEAKVLEKCRRRCCVCFVLENNDSQRDGQLSHLDHDNSNGDPDNFVFLCLRHHNIYDSKMSQAKNMTEREVRLYQAKLHQAVEHGDVPSKQGAVVLKFPAQQVHPVNISGDHNVVATGNVNYTVNMPRPKRGKGRAAARPPIIPGTVSEDARMAGYLNYLVRRYEKFKKWDCDRNGQRMGYGVIRNSYKRDMKYELIHTPKTLFDAGARYLQERIESTRLGKMKRMQKLYSAFQDFDEQTSNDEGLPV
jgi:hypothetical protein